MKTRCRVCNSESRNEIEIAIARGVKFSEITKMYGIYHTTLLNHKRMHMPQDIAKDLAKGASCELEVLPSASERAKNLPRLDRNILGCVLHIHSKCLQLQQDAEDDNDRVTLLHALKLDMDCVSLFLRSREILLASSAQDSWEMVFPELLKALEKFPEARIAAAKAVHTLKMITE